MYPLINQPAPAFALPSEENETLTLADLTQTGDALLVFVYGTYCPTCVETFMRLARDTAAFERAGVQVTVVSLDEREKSKVFKLGMHRPIPFPILSDVDGEVHKLYHSYEHSFGAAYIRQDGIVANGVQAERYPGTSLLLRLPDATGAA